LAAATIFIALVIFCVDLTDAIRPLSALRLAILLSSLRHPGGSRDLVG
jgi:hypothetical protein